MAMQFYASPEQMMRDRSEYARKNIARGRNTIVLTYSGGVLFVAENLSKSLHKIGEIYDRIGFAAVGRYNEFENLRRAGVRMADMNGYSYDRRDVTALLLAQAYAQVVGAIFTEQTKPFEVEISVAQVNATPEQDELYRITYDGSVTDEPGVLVMGGQSDAISGGLRARHQPAEDRVRPPGRVLMRIAGIAREVRAYAADGRAPAQTTGPQRIKMREAHARPPCRPARRPRYPHRTSPERGRRLHRVRDRQRDR